MSAMDKEFVALDWLYQEIILDHYKRPRNFGALEHPDVSADEENPYCGDHIAVQVRMDGDRIADIRFSGRGCAISQASASMMTEKVKGISLAVCRRFSPHDAGRETISSRRGVGGLGCPSGRAGVSCPHQMRHFSVGCVATRLSPTPCPKGW